MAGLVLRETDFRADRNRQSGMTTSGSEPGAVEVCARVRGVLHPGFVRRQFGCFGFPRQAGGGYSSGRCGSGQFQEVAARCAFYLGLAHGLLLSQLRFGA